MKHLLNREQRQHLFEILALFLAERRAMLMTGALLAAIAALSGIALLGVSGWFITMTALAGLSAATALTFDVFVPAATIRLLAILRTASRYGERLATHDATLSILVSLREKLFRGWAEPGAARLLLNRPATLLFRLTVDIDALDSLYLRILVPALTALAAVLFCGVGLAIFVHPLLGLALAFWLVLIGFGAPLIGSSAANTAARRRAYGLEALRARTIDLVSGQTELAVAGRLRAQCDAILAANTYLAKADRTFNNIETFTSAAFGIASAIALTATVLTVGALVEAGALTAPVAAFAILITLSSMEPFGNLRRGALELGRTALAARRLAPRLRPTPPPLAVEPPSAGLALKLDALCAAHAASAPLITNLSLRLKTGEHVALVGASGSGKSTLLSVITGELAPLSGQIKHLPATLLPQKTELFHDSIRENLRLAAPQADDARLWEALEAAGLTAAIRALSQGLDTLLGESGLGLSGGQGRRLALARMMLRDTPFWLFDEPTESIDHLTAVDILNRLKVASRGKTLLIATHIRREAELADRILVMRHGMIVADVQRGDSGFEAAINNLKDS